MPATGPAIIAPNHFSFWDHFLAVYLRRKVQFMHGRSSSSGRFQFIFSHGGVFPILRGRRDEEAFKTAHAVLERGNLVVMYARRPVAHAGARRAEAGCGAAGPRDGRPGGAGRDRRLGEGAQLEAAAVPEGHRPVRDPVRFERVDTHREQAQAASKVVFERIKDLYRRPAAGRAPPVVRAARAARAPCRGRGRGRGPAAADALTPAQAYS